MFKTFYKLGLVFVLNLIISDPLYAKLVEQKDINFPIKSKALLSGENHYFFSIVTPKKMNKISPDISELDTLDLNREKNAILVLSKTVLIVDKPVGFFDDKQLIDETYLAAILSGQKLKKLGPASYKITVPGEMSYSYKMNSFFDANDVSTLPNSKVIRAVAAAQKLDVISQSASNIMFVEKTNFSKYTEGGVAVSSYIPMKENKTLIITYQLWAVKKPFAKENVLKTHFLNEVEAVKELMNNFKP
jgi:hypothetical protein